MVFGVEPSYRPITLLGFLLIFSGVILVALPFIARNLPSIEKLPWILVWVYRRDNFYFITSPLLIIISLISLLFRILWRQA